MTARVDEVKADNAPPGDKPEAADPLPNGKVEAVMTAPANEVKAVNTPSGDEFEAVTDSVGAPEAVGSNSHLQCIALCPR
jgi:hypothetical protein